MCYVVLDRQPVAQTGNTGTWHSSTSC
jgi:hypothetical protein